MNRWRLTVSIHFNMTHSGSIRLRNILEDLLRKSFVSDKVQRSRLLLEINTLGWIDALLLTERSYWSLESEGELGSIHGIYYDW